MAKGKKGYRTSGAALNAQYDTRFKDHNLAATNPNKEQFAPTDSAPVRQHARMAGDDARSSGGDSLGTYLASKFNKASKAADKAVAPAKEKKDTTPRRQALDKAIEG